MPSNLSKARLSKAFNEGRRAALAATAENPYDNPTLRRLWEDGRRRQAAGEIEAPIPPLAHGETRAQRAPQNPPGAKAAARPPARPRNSGPRRFGSRGPRRP